MKKSIAFLGALLFGSVTFGQVTKNDSIKKSASRKVSIDDVKKFPADSETSAIDAHIKGKTLEENNKQQRTSEKHPKEFIKHAALEKHSSDASAGTGSKIKGSVTQKGKVGEAVFEKQSSNPISTFKGGEVQKSKAAQNEVIIEKTPLIEKTGGSSSTQTTGSTDVFIKIGDIKGEKDDK